MIISSDSLHNSFFIPKYQLLDVVPAHVFMDKPEWFGIGLRADYPELVSILNKGIALISEPEIHAIISKWSYLPKQEESTELSKDEKAWISQNHVVDVRIVEFPPYAILTERGPSGVVIDFLNKVSAQTGVQFNFKVSNQSYKTDLEDLKNLKGFDLIPGMMFSEEEQWSVSFSQPIYNSPIVIFTRIDAEFISTINDLPGKKVAATNGSLIIPTIRDHYPEVNMHACKNGSEGILMLAEGKVDAFIDNLTATSYFIQKYGITNVRVAAPSPLPMHEYGFGGRKDWPELTSIIDKVWAEVSEEEKSAMLGKYLSVQYDHGIHKEDILKWVLIFGICILLIFFLIIFWNRSLKLKIAERTSEIIEKESRFRRLVEQTPMAIEIHDLEGKIVQANPAFAAMHNLEGEALNQVLTHYNVRKDEQAEALGLKPYIERVYAGEDVIFPPYKYSTDEATKSLGHETAPHELWTQVRGFPLKNSNGQVINAVFFAEDISEKMQGQALLEVSERRFRATFEQAAVGIAHVSHEGSFLRINQKFCDIVGYSQKEMLEGAFQDITHPDDLEADLEKVNKLLEGELETYSMEKRYFHKSRAIVWVNLTVSLLRTSAGKPDYFISVIEEITDKKATESQLRESEEKFRGLIEQSPLSLLICDKEGRTVDVNKAWLNLWNLTEEDLPAVKENYNLLHDAGATKLGMLPLIERAFKGETIMLPEIEYESAGAMETMGLSNEKAKSIWLKGQLYPVKDEEGNIKNIISIAEDITQRKQADEKLKKKEEELKGNEAILSALLENSLDLIAYRDMKHCLVMFNEAFTKLVWDVFAIRLGTMPLIEKALKGEVVELPLVEYVSKNTTDTIGVETTANKRWVEIRLYP